MLINSLILSMMPALASASGEDGGDLAIIFLSALSQASNSVQRATVTEPSITLRLYSRQFAGAVFDELKPRGSSSTTVQYRVDKR